VEVKVGKGTLVGLGRKNSEKGDFTGSGGNEK